MISACSKNNLQKHAGIIILQNRINLESNIETEYGIIRIPALAERLIAANLSREE